MSVADAPTRTRVCSPRHWVAISIQARSFLVAAVAIDGHATGTLGLNLPTIAIATAQQLVLFRVEAQIVAALTVRTQSLRAIYHARQT
jgi:hypothetical protein